MSIKLQFVADDSAESKAIEWFSHGMFSHVDAVMPDGSLLGARLVGGVEIRPSDYEVFARKLVVELPVTQPMEAAFYSFIRSQIGTPYDRTAIVGFLAGRNWMENDSWFCSELQAAGLIRCGVLRYPPATPTNKITPDDLLLMCSVFVPVTVPPAS